MQTTAGSYALLGSVPSGDSTVVARLRSAGAIILGKTNLTQWCNSQSELTATTLTPAVRSDDFLSAWSSIGGQVLLVLRLACSLLRLWARIADASTRLARALGAPWLRIWPSGSSRSASRAAGRLSPQLLRWASSV